MMPTEHDEDLVERMALALHTANNRNGGLCDASRFCSACEEMRAEARAVIYPPAPPKTRLQVAREMYAKAYSIPVSAPAIQLGQRDDDPAMLAILAALALPAMED